TPSDPAPAPPAPPVSPPAISPAAAAEPIAPAPQTERPPVPAPTGRANGAQLLGRAQKAAARGRLYGKPDAAVELLMEARDSRAPPAGLRKLETTVIQKIQAKAQKDTRRRDYHEAAAGWAAILKLRPDNRAAQAALREAERHGRR